MCYKADRYLCPVHPYAPQCDLDSPDRRFSCLLPAPKLLPSNRLFPMMAVCIGFLHAGQIQLSHTDSTAHMSPSSCPNMHNETIYRTIATILPSGS